MTLVIVKNPYALQKKQKVYAGSLLRTKVADGTVNKMPSPSSSQNERCPTVADDQLPSSSSVSASASASLLSSSSVVLGKEEAAPEVSFPSYNIRAPPKKRMALPFQTSTPQPPSDEGEASQIAINRSVISSSCSSSSCPQSPRGKLFKMRKDQEALLGNTTNSTETRPSTPEQHQQQPSPQHSLSIEGMTAATVANTGSTSKSCQPADAARLKGIFKRRHNGTTCHTEGSGGATSCVGGQTVTHTSSTERKGVRFDPATTKLIVVPSISSPRHSTSSVSHRPKKHSGPSTLTSVQHRPYRSLFKSKLKSQYRQEIAALKKQRQQQKLQQKQNKLKEHNQKFLLQQQQQQQQQEQQLRDGEHQQQLRDGEQSQVPPIEECEISRIKLPAKIPSKQPEHELHVGEHECKASPRSNKMHKSKRKATEAGLEVSSPHCFRLHQQDRTETIRYSRSWEESDTQAFTCSAKITSPIMRRSTTSRPQSEEEGGTDDDNRRDGSYRSLPQLKTIVSISPTTGMTNEHTKTGAQEEAANTSSAFPEPTVEIEDKTKNRQTALETSTLASTHGSHERQMHSQSSCQGQHQRYSPAFTTSGTWMAPSPSQHPHPPHVSPAPPQARSYWGPAGGPVSSPVPHHSRPPPSNAYGHEEYYYHNHHYHHPAQLPPMSPHDSQPRSLSIPGRGFGNPADFPHPVSYGYSPVPPHHHQMMNMMRMQSPGVAAATFPSYRPPHHPPAYSIEGGGRVSYPQQPSYLVGASADDDDETVVELGYSGPQYAPYHPLYLPRMEPSYGNGGGGLGVPSLMPCRHPPPNQQYVSSPHPHYGPPSFGPSRPEHRYWAPVPSWTPSSYRNTNSVYHPQLQRSSSYRSSPTMSPHEDQHRQHYEKQSRLPPPIPVLQSHSPKPNHLMPTTQPDREKDSSTGRNKRSSGNSAATKNGSGSSKAAVKSVIKIMANVLEPPCPLAQDFQKLDTAIVLLKPRGGEHSFGISIHVYETSTLVEVQRTPTVVATAHSGTPPKQEKSSHEHKSSELELDSRAEDESETKAVELEQRDNATANEQQMNETTTTEGTRAPEVEANLKRPDHRRRRRRRVFFPALAILDADVQNERQKKHAAKRCSYSQATEHLPPLNLLEVGDIILSIAGQSTAGLNFSECCELFQQKSLPESKESFAKDDDSVKGGVESASEEKKAAEEAFEEMICVPIEIARRKRPKPLPVPPSVTEKDGNQQPLVAPNPKITITNSHLTLLAKVVLEALLELGEGTVDHGRMVLGRADSLDVLLQTRLALTIPDVGCSVTMLADLMTAWKKTCKGRLRGAYQRALAHWKEVWIKEEPKSVQDLHPNPLSDRQRSLLRFAPRPAAGCRCSSKQHMYVNHPDCPLYSNLRGLEEEKSKKNDDGSDSVDSDDKCRDSMKSTKQVLNDTKSSILSSSMKSVENAVVNRLKRRKAENISENEEAHFVMRMEQVQLKVCKQAIMAPSLTAMVLSAVADLREHGPDRVSTKCNQSSERKESTSTVEDEDDDDIPLADLAKNQDSNRPCKKQKHAAQVSLHYMARLARHISWTWGHVAQEPSNLDHAWRWEVFHGQHNHNSDGSSSVASDFSWDAKAANNPRQPGSYSWEHIRWLLDEDTVVRPLAQIKSLQTTEAYNENQQFALQCLAQVLDPRGGTGLMEEVTALLHTQVLEVSDDDGSLKLAQDWYMNVDVLLLEQMDSSWGPDPLRFRMNDKVSTTLRREWIKIYKAKDAEGGEESSETSTVGAWASRWCPTEPIYELEEFATWRHALEQREETQSNEQHGIGQFGV